VPALLLLLDALAVVQADLEDTSKFIIKYVVTVFPSPNLAFDDPNTDVHIRKKLKAFHARL